MTEPPAPAVRTVTLRAAMQEAAELCRAKRHDECEAICREVLQHKPGHAHALHLLGVVAMQRGDDEAALPLLEQALARQGDNAELHTNLGTLLGRLNRCADALPHFRRAIELAPEHVEAHANFASLLLDEDRLAEALAEYLEAARIAPAREDAWIGAGCARKQLLQLPEAAACFRRAIAAGGGSAEAHANLAMVLLQMDAFAEGWREYEWRFQAKDWGSRTFRQPRWDGGSLACLKVLVPCEQGLGDTIQFVRYLPELKARGAKVVFECRPELQGLLRGFPGIDLMIDWPRGSDVESGVDCHVPLMSLPLHLGTDLANLPAPVPYLSAPPEFAEAWRRRLWGTDACRVGLVWSGNPLHFKDRLRSCRLADFAPLAGVPGTAFFSLQKGPSADQAKAPPPGLEVADLQAELGDFRDTAGAIAHLDLVVTVDTSVAHLAGAMGKPVWVLLPFSPDWRWLVERDDTPWYPTMRLFRQSRCGDWAETFQRVAAALGEWTAQRGPVRVLRDPPPLDEVRRLLQDGRHAEAEQACLLAVASHPHHGEAMQILAGLAFQAGRGGESVQWFQRLARLRPGEVANHFNLGVALAGLGKVDEAAASYERAVAVDPHAAESHFNLANLRRDAGRADDALSHYRQALAAKPGYVKARVNLGNLLRREGRHDEAVAELSHALALRPGNAKAHLGLADALKRSGQPTQAASHLGEAARLAPDAAPIQREAGVGFRDLGLLERSLACLDRAVELQPQDAAAHAHRAAALQRSRRDEEATAALRFALGLQPLAPQDALALAIIAIADFGWLDEAEALLQQCLRHDPDWPEARFELGEVRLFQGRWREGFAEQAWRTRVRSFRRASPAAPTWGGTVDRGKTLLLYGEQGAGDMIQCVRYLPLAAERVGRVVVGCPQPLVRLFAALPNVAVAAAEGEPLGPFDLCASILDLPVILGDVGGTVPAQVPYLRVPAPSRPLSAALGDHRLKVGLAWAGNPSHAHDYKRSCPWAEFRRLLDFAGAAFFSLQVGDPAKALGDDERSRMVDLAPELTDWAATAAVVAEIDLVISVDTGVAHLAGALARPVWLLLPSVPDARWMRDGASSPWYPTMTLFRQDRSGDWGGAIERVGSALNALVRNRVSSPDQALRVES